MQSDKEDVFFHTEMAIVTRTLVRTEAGQHAADILGSSDGAISCLKDTDPAVRFCALNACNFLWGLLTDVRYLDGIVAMLEIEPDERCLLSIALQLGQCLSGTKSPNVKNLLARITLQKERSSRIKWVAFQSLWRIEYGSSLRPPRNDQFIDSVVYDLDLDSSLIDMKFVNECL